jgi:hypothetical protein
MVVFAVVAEIGVWKSLKHSVDSERIKKILTQRRQDAKFFPCALALKVSGFANQKQKD